MKAKNIKQLIKKLLRTINKFFNVFFPNIKKGIITKTTQNKRLYQIVQGMMDNPPNLYSEPLGLKTAILLDLKRFFFEPFKIIIRFIVKYTKNFVYALPLANSKKIKVLSFASLDPLGYTVMYRKKILRLIYNESETYLVRLFESGLLDELITSGLLVNSWISSYKNNEYKIIVEHKKLTNISSFYWSFEMLKDAAIIVLKLQSILQEKGYTLIDGHYRNILFENNIPKWIDIGSIITDTNNRNSWGAMKEFIYSFIVPLAFYKIQEYSLFSLKLYGFSYFFPQKELSESFIFCKFKEIVAGLYTESLSLKKLDNNDFLAFLMKEMNPEWINTYISINNKQTLWTDYQSILTEEHIQRYEIISEKIASLKDAKSLVDLAGNTAQLSMAVRKKNNNIKIISTDYDMTVIDKAYEYFKNNPQNIEVYLFNFMITLGEIPPDFISDIAVAMAVTHHLILTQGYKIDDILAKVKSLSKRYAFVEFMPLGLYGGGDELPFVPDWYTREWFRENFGKYFKIQEEIVTSRVVVNGKNLEHRILFFGIIR